MRSEVPASGGTLRVWANRMKVIGIETSANTGSVALMISGRLACERFFTKGLRHGKELVPVIDAVLKDHGLKPEDVDLFAVSRGPGSYTGIRVGVTCAKAMAYALGKKLAGVPSLDVLAQNAPASARKVYCMVDAKRKRVYFCSYHRDESGLLVRDTDCAAVPLAQALGAIEPGGFVIGDAIGLQAEAFAARGAALAREDLWLPRASAVAALGDRNVRTSGADDPFTLVPIYLHRPEAEEVWERKKRQKDEDGNTT